MAMESERTVAFLTLGCKVNQADTDSLAGAFLAGGFSVVDFGACADVYVVNTCTVTNLADRKSRQMLRRAVRLNPGAVVVATGCFAQTQGDQLADEVPGVSIVVGTRDRARIVELARARLGDPAAPPVRAVLEYGPASDFEEVGTPSLLERTRATLKIEDGCDEFCSYCKVPYARGPVRSRDFDSIAAEAHRLAGLGFREIVLTGVHLGHYGKDKGYEHRLSDVLETVAGVPGIRRVRLSSIDPTDVSDRIIDLVAGHSGVCRHLHIPLQGGHNEVLRRMNRKYTLEAYGRLIDAIRHLCPSVAITTDIIVGFPGETPDHFRSTMDAVTALRFSRLHVFKYSPRSGTPASAFPGQVSVEDKDKRSEQLISLGWELASSYNATMVGTIQEVLVEGTQGRFAEGLTDTYVRVRCAIGAGTEGCSIAQNSLATVRIESATPDGLWGTLVEDIARDA